MMTGPLITPIFNVNSVKKLSNSVNHFLLNELFFFAYGSFTAQWKGQKLAGKILLTWKKSLVGSFLNQKPHQNHQLIAEMFVFLTDRFGGRRVKIPSKITEFTFFGRKLVPAGNWATHCKPKVDCVCIVLFHTHTEIFAVLLPVI